MSQKDGVIGIIFNTDRTEVLLIQRQDLPVWVLPGGGIDPGESPEMAAKREVEEETGLQVRILRKVAEYTPINFMTAHTYFYEFEAIGGSLQTGSETKSLAYFPLDRLPKPLPLTYRFWIRDAEQKGAPPLLKAIEGASLWQLALALIQHPIIVIKFLKRLVWKQ